jgi:hypothetical protein
LIEDGLIRNQRRGNEGQTSRWMQRQQIKDAARKEEQIKEGGADEQMDAAATRST